MRYNTTLANDTNGPDNFKETSKIINDAIKDYYTAKLAFQATFRANFDTLAKSFFVAVPEVTSVSWTQYTPYFMDGDACEFSVNELEFNTNSGNYSMYSMNRSNLSAEKIALCKELQDMIYGQDDMMLDIFGDHVEIIMTPEGSDVNDYDHD